MFETVIIATFLFTLTCILGGLILMICQSAYDSYCLAPTKWERMGAIVKAFILISFIVSAVLIYFT